MKVEVEKLECIDVDWDICPQIVQCKTDNGVLYVAYKSIGISDTMFIGVVLEDESGYYSRFEYNDSFSKILFTKFDGVITIKN